MNDSNTLRGVVHGKMIELDADIGLPDGEVVSVTVQALSPQPQRTPPGEGIKRAAGGWADDPEGLDAYLEWSRQQRKQGRRPIDP
jgi:hypothetical protein